MTDEKLNAPAKQPFKTEVTPDSLMGDFRTRSLFGVIILVLFAHVIFIGVFSIDYLKEEFLGEDTSEMTEEERLDVAVREATTLLRDVAEQHDISPQELSSRFAGSGGTLPDSTTDPEPVETDVQPDTPDSSPDVPDTQPDQPADPDEPEEPAEPGSSIEQTLQETVPGPDLPELPPEDDDLFN